MPVLLTIKENNEEKSVRLTSQPLIMGRSSKCHVQIQDQMCSGKHCAFKINQNFQVLVKDLESTNGTYLNDCQIMDSHLMLDDIIRIGSCEISIDPSQLSAREKAVLTRDEPTAQIKFMDLPSNRKALKPSQVVRKREAPQPPKKLFPEKPRPVQEKVTTTNNSILPKSTEEKSKTNTSLKDRLAAKGKSIKDKSKSSHIDVSNERQIDLEESSGDTQFIKISKPTESTKRKEKTSFASKIKKAFKK